MATAPEPGEPVSEEEHRRRVSAGFVLFASQLAGALQAARNAFGHDLARGEYLEGILKSALRDILPTGYNLFSGQIISTTSISRQQDLVVVDSKNVSSLLRSEDLGIVPIESVSGTIEVKTSLTKKPSRRPFAMSSQQCRSGAWSDTPRGHSFFRLRSHT